MFIKHLMLKAYCLTLLTTIIFPSFSQNKKEPLSKKQADKSNWIILFDGSNLDKWRGFKKDSIPKGWQIENKELVLTGGGAGDLITKDQFDNFILELEWKISEGGNSGIFFDVVEEDQYTTTYQTGPEVQILDDERHPDAKLGKNGNRKAGSLYDMIPTKKPAKPAGEYNKIRIVVKNGHVEHWLNGEKVVEYQMWNEQWDKLVAESKFKGWPGFAKYKKGHIALQDHGNKVWFKNIRIQIL